MALLTTKSENALIDLNDYQDINDEGQVYPIEFTPLTEEDIMKEKEKVEQQSVYEEVKEFIDKNVTTVVIVACLTMVAVISMISMIQADKLVEDANITTKVYADRLAVLEKDLASAEYDLDKVEPVVYLDSGGVACKMLIKGEKYFSCWYLDE